MAASPPRLPPGYTLIALDAVGSTNDEARARARLGAADGTIVWARSQTAGRGRRGRAWASPAGNLYVSLLLRPSGPPATVAQLGFVAALALADTLQQAAPLAATTLKWPNDVLLGGRKLAGILLESEGARRDGVDALILGLGVNLAAHPADAEFPATDLRAEGATLAAEAALESFVAAFDRWRQRWVSEGFAPARAAWRARAHGLGQPIRVRLADATLEGIFADLDAEGFLLLDTRDGRRRVSAGDVFFAS